MNTYSKIKYSKEKSIRKGWKKEIREDRNKRGQPCDIRNESNSVTLNESCHISGHQVPLLGARQSD